MSGTLAIDACRFESGENLSRPFGGAHIDDASGFQCRSKVFFFA
jgi:hypothetical protein